MGRIGVEDVRRLMAELAGPVDAGTLSAKTVNNTLGTLVVCLNAAAEDGLIAANPALRVERLPPAHIEREYLRLHEIPVDLDACDPVYRPLADVPRLGGAQHRLAEKLVRLGRVVVGAEHGATRQSSKMRTL